MVYYAHTKPDRPCAEWEPLAKHLHNVSNLAADFASMFGAAQWGELAGLWHDVGKYSAGFQAYLYQQNSIEAANAHVEMTHRVDHSTLGAQWASRKGQLGRVLAYIIAGHHAGLADTDGDSGLGERLRKDVGAEETLRTIENEAAGLLEHGLPDPPAMTMGTRAERAFQISFFTRMLFSCLVDADFLATEAFMNPVQSSDQSALQIEMADLRAALDRSIDTMSDRAEATPVNQRRMAVLEACRLRALDTPGFFSLTVPTGGGKTLSSLAFALRHAETHGLRRIIVGIPYTSIIEQNAGQFRRALGSHARTVLEHHSTYEPRHEDRWSRLASENWDAPIVVTTTIQLYESLFANRTSRCRKLHNIARSIIILDEVQSIPVRLLRPTLAAIHELVRNYGCTVVLCTATQPAVGRRPSFEIGLPLDPRREIAPDVAGLFSDLKRVEIEPIRDIPDDELADELSELSQVLCIVHTRGQARELFQHVSGRCGEDDGRSLWERSSLHLSTDMCPAHRSLVLRLIRRRLRLGVPCRVISTSLIEAGVDVDFPVVYRAVAGLDSITQAAGRCNREGRLDRPGRVVVFRPGNPLPAMMQELKLAIQDTESVMRNHTGDLLQPDAIHAYFSEHYWKRSGEWDHKQVMDCFKGGGAVLDFRSAAERYRVIDSEQTPVVVPWGRRGRALMNELRSLDRPVDRFLRRRAQRLSVGLWPRVLRALQENGAVYEPECSIHGQAVGIGVQILASPEAYDPATGINPQQTHIDPGWLIEGI